MRSIAKSTSHLLLSFTQSSKHILARIIYEVIPPVELHWKNREFDFSFRITENQDSLNDFKEDTEEALSIATYGGDDVLSTAEKANQLELERSSELDNKASTYFTNVGIVLSILSIGPIIAFALDLSMNTIYQLNEIQMISLVAFSYALLMFFLSAIYSYWAMKVTEYESFYRSDILISKLKNNEFGTQQRALDLLICRRKNEEHTQDKLNRLFAAESSHRNGMFALAMGVVTASVSILI